MSSTPPTVCVWMRPACQQDVCLAEQSRGKERQRSRSTWGRLADARNPYSTAHIPGRALTAGKVGLLLLRLQYLLLALLWVCEELLTDAGCGDA